MSLLPKPLREDYSSSILHLDFVFVFVGPSLSADFSKPDINAYYLMIFILCSTIDYLFYPLNIYLFTFEYPFSALIATMIFS